MRDLTLDRLAALLADELDREPADTFRPADDLTAHAFPSADGLTVHGHLSTPTGPGPIRRSWSAPRAPAGTGRQGPLRQRQRARSAALRRVRRPHRRPARRPGPRRGVRRARRDGRRRHRRRRGGGPVPRGPPGDRRRAAERPGNQPGRVLRPPGAGARTLAVAARRPPHGPVRPGPARRGGDRRAGHPASVPRRRRAGGDPRLLRRPAAAALRSLETVEAPLFVVHGEADEVVPASQAVDLTDRAERLGLPATLVTVPGLGHDDQHTDEAWPELWSRVTDFLGVGMTRTDEVRTDAVIVGAGMSGLCQAVEFARAGVDFVVLEKADDLGGTWRDNTYPGASCDVESHLYSYSFEPDPGWSSTFARQPEILAYLRQVARRRGVLPRFRFGTDVTGARWEPATSEWTVTTADGTTYLTRFLVLGVGGLHTPRTPTLPGDGDFLGEIWHSSRWNHDVDLAGKHVAVVGWAPPGADHPEVARRADQLTVFQRTPAWVLPKADAPHPAWRKRLFRLLPWAQALYRLRIHARREMRASASTGVRTRCGWRRTSCAARSTARSTTRAARDAHPAYRLGCKRVLLSSDYYRTLNARHVHVVPGGPSPCAPVPSSTRRAPSTRRTWSSTPPASTWPVPTTGCASRAPADGCSRTPGAPACTRTTVSRSPASPTCSSSWGPTASSPTPAS
ncbi:NAD(P)-binding protein [Streptomyces sp. M19]